ncbi:MAG TPA: hypothetical protein VJ842_19065 [Pyrinomonadaceae bacterium]|nr:hypothetical protein [Pyrinomonadaceae bacterium]
MTGEEMERAIEFLLKNQAAFEARQAAFEASLAATKETFEASLAASQAAFDKRQAALSAKQDRTQEHLDHLTRVVAHIAELTQRHSEEIDVLGKLVGGLIERGNDKPDK